MASKPGKTFKRWRALIHSEGHLARGRVVRRRISARARRASAMPETPTPGTIRRFIEPVYVWTAWSVERRTV